MQTLFSNPWIIHRKQHKVRETGKQEFYHKNITSAATTEALEVEEYLQEILTTDKPHISTANTAEMVVQCYRKKVQRGGDKGIQAMKRTD